MVVADSEIEEIENIKPEVKNVPKGKPVVLTLEILKLIKDAQQQHGLRHGDYQRYRCYCTRRIRRLRKVLKVTQGDRRHFKKKDVTEVMLKDERYLYIPLMMAERAWGYAMQLRQEANTEPRKRFHLVQRLRKAAGHALRLQELCESSVCDARTKLEAQAYVAWIQGSLHFELSLWKPAVEHLKTAQVVYEKLLLALSEEDQVMYRARVDELRPSLRYCSYNLGDEVAVDEVDLLAMRSQGQGDLLASFDSLMEKKRQQRSDGSTEVTWRSRSVPIRPERVAVFLLAEKQVDSALAKAASDVARVELLENHLMDCKDAMAAVREEMKNDPASKAPRERSTPLPSLPYLLSHLTHLRLSRTIQRNLLMACQLEERSKEGKAKPRDLPRLYEMILQNLAEMSALPGVEEDVEYQAEVEGRVKMYKAYRCFYIAEYLTSMKRWRDAISLYQRCRQYIASLKPAPAELGALDKRAEGGELSALAHNVLDDEEEVRTEKRQFASKKALFDRLYEYKEDPALLSAKPNVLKIPPDMRPIPCKPLFFDLASNVLQFPPLEGKTDAQGRKQNPAGLTGFVKGLWGWGGASK